MTDAEIIKALECRVKDKCPECPYFHSYPCDKCRNMQTDALDLINRLQAEVERLRNKAIKQRCELENLREFSNELKQDNRIFAENQMILQKMLKTIKAEAYKECIEKVNTIICDNTYPDFDKKGKAVCIWKPEAYKNINSLLKELVGEECEKTI